MTGKASRDRGANAERAVVNWLRANGHPEARRHHGADGRAPGDIMGVPGVCIEVKDRASSSYGVWREQLLAETPNGHVPVLVRRTRGVTDVGQWDAEMPVTTHVDFGQSTFTNRFCPRTDQHWIRMTFAHLIEALR